MTYYTYFVIRQILMGLLIFMGLHMMFVRIPTEIKNTFFHKSIRVMGLSFLFVPISCYTYTLNNRLDLQPYISTAINLTAYYATFVLMSVAFLMLLGKEYIKKLMVVVYAAIILFPTPLWISIYLGNPKLISTVTTASYSYFIAMIIAIVTHILYRHKQATKNIDNYYSDDMAICVKWISKSNKMLLGLATACIFAPSFISYPRWLRFIFMIYGILCYIHIYYGYRQLMINLSYYFIKLHHDPSSFVEAEQSIKKSEEPVLNSEITEQISTRIEEWINEKAYTHNSLTINDVAKYISTNRTYLSKYINSTFKCSFRAWVTQLRIEEAKRLLSIKSDLTVDIISSATGFASAESFTHIFTRITGTSPAKWREEHS